MSDIVIALMLPIAIVIHGWIVSRAIRSLAESKVKPPDVFDPNRRGA